MLRARHVLNNLFMHTISCEKCLNGSVLERSERSSEVTSRQHIETFHRSRHSASAIKERTIHKYTIGLAFIPNGHCLIVCMGLGFIEHILLRDQSTRRTQNIRVYAPSPRPPLAEQPAAVAWIFILNNANGAGDLSIHQLLIVNTSAGPVKPLFESCQCACTAHYWLETRMAMNHSGVRLCPDRARRVGGQGRRGADRGQIEPSS